MRRRRTDASGASEAPRKRPRRRRYRNGEVPAYANAAPHRHGARMARKDVPRGCCRVCGDPVAATRGRVRSWHDGRAIDGGDMREPNCLHRYKIATRPSYGKRIIAKRDGRGCKTCGAKRGTSYAWLHLDHVQPLWDGGQAVEENLQLLCPDCHKDKTAIEAGIRAQRRREAKDAA